MRRTLFAVGSACWAMVFDRADPNRHKRTKWVGRVGVGLRVMTAIPRVPVRVAEESRREVARHLR